MELDIKEIIGDIKFDEKIITINNGCIILNDGTIIRSGNSDTTLSHINKDTKNNNDLWHEEFEVKEFNTLIVNSYINVDFSIGKQYKVYVEAPKEIVETLAIENKGNELHLNIKQDTNDTHNIVLKVVAPSLSKIIANNISIVNVHAPIQNNNIIMLSAHEGSKITLSTITCANVYITVTEGATMTIGNIEASKSIIAKTTQGAHINITEYAHTPNIYINTEQGSTVDMRGVNADQIIAKSGGASTIMLAGEAKDAEYIAGKRSNIIAQELVAINGKATTTELAHIKCNVTEHFEKHSSILAKIVNK